MTRSQHIQSVFEKYGTDKAEHGYAEFYAQHMPENPKSILEIGVKGAASIQAWRELFPEAFIVGVDLFQEFPVPAHLQNSNTKFIKGNQCDWRLLEQLRDNNFEVIIDDGSHNWRDQMITFFGLAQPGCLYFIEDIHTNSIFENEYSQNLPYELNAHNTFHGDLPYVWNNYIFEHGTAPSAIKLIKC